MKTSSFDKAAGAIFRAFGKRGIKPDARRKLELRFQKLIASRRADPQEAVTRGFEQIRYHWHENTRLPEVEYGRTVAELLRSGLPLAAAGMFVACVDSFAKLELQEVTSLAPSAGCADAWVKAKKANRKSIQKAVAAAPESFYGSALADWFVAKAPVKNALNFARLALSQRSRPAHLPAGRELLIAVLKRDRKNVLGDALAHEAIRSQEAVVELLTAAVAYPKSLEPLARSLGYAVASGADPATVGVVAEALEDVIQSEDPGVAKLASQLGAHVVTTWRLAAGTKAGASTEQRLQQFASKVLVGAQAGSRPELWIACPSGLISEALDSGEGKVSSQGALEVALALRAAQTGADAGDALWTFAFNVNIREMGTPGDSLSFDPRLHEDVKGGLLRGDVARVLRCGWEYGGRVLVRTQVEPV